jgi:putative spermidine/putrescine transport system permease protein
VTAVAVAAHDGAASTVAAPGAADDERERLTWGQRAILWLPVAALAVFFLVPFGLIAATSFYRRIEGGFYEPGFVFDSWSRLFSDVYVGRTLFSLRLCLLVALLTTVVAFPFTWFLTRMRVRAQVPLLVLVLGALTLSEVIVAFSWDLILGRATGITNILVWAGMMSEPKAFTPGFWSVVAGLSYTSFPYAVLTLFPSLNRVDREVTEAAGTLGASPWRTFTTVVVPLCRQALLAAFLLVFVFTLGSNIIAQVLGRPQHWTLAVVISDQATMSANVPFAAAIAVFLTLISLAVVGIVSFAGSRSWVRQEAEDAATPEPSVPVAAGMA